MLKYWLEALFDKTKVTCLMLLLEHNIHKQAVF